MNRVNKFSVDIDSLGYNQIYVSPGASGTGATALDPIDINNIKPKLIPFAHNKIIFLPGNHILKEDYTQNTMKRHPTDDSSGEGADINFFLNFEDYASIELTSFDRENLAVLATEHTISGYISENETGSPSPSETCTAHNYDETTICFYNCRSFKIKDIIINGNSTLKCYSSTGVIENVFMKQWATVGDSRNLAIGVQTGIDIFNSTVQIFAPPEFEQTPDYYDETINGGLHITRYMNNLATETVAFLFDGAITIRNNGNLVQDTPAMITFKSNSVQSTKHLITSMISHTNSSVRVTNMLTHNINQPFWFYDGTNVFVRSLRMNANSIPVNGIGIVYDKAKLDFGTDNNWASANVYRTNVASFQIDQYTGATNNPDVNGYILNANRFGQIAIQNLVLKVMASGFTYLKSGPGCELFINTLCIIKPDNATTHGAENGAKLDFSGKLMFWTSGTHEVTTKNTGTDTIFNLTTNSFAAISTGVYTGTNLYAKDADSYLWINGVTY